jgi:hypothetical protein
VTLLYNLLDEPLIRTRLVADGQPRSFSLPGLFVALGQDAIRDFPALRPINATLGTPFLCNWRRSPCTVPGEASFSIARRPGNRLSWISRPNIRMVQPGA